MEVKKITEGMTAQQVAQVIDDNFKGLNEEKANKGKTEAKLSELDSEVTDYKIKINGEIYNFDKTSAEYTFVNNILMSSSSLTYISTESSELCSVLVAVKSGDIIECNAINLYIPSSKNYAVVGFSVEYPNVGGNFTMLKEATEVGTVSFKFVHYVERDGYVVFFYGNNKDVISNKLQLNMLKVINSKFESLRADIKNLNDNLIETENKFSKEIQSLNGQLSEEISIKESVSKNVAGLIMRNTNGKFEATSAVTRRIYYIQINEGEKVSLIGNNIYTQAASWSLVGFSREIPTSGIEYDDVYSADSSGAKNYNIEYTAQEDGYLCLYYENEPDINTRVTFYRIKLEPINLKSLVNESSEDAKDAISSNKESFIIGCAKVRAITNNRKPLVVSSDGSNYNECIDEYINTYDARFTGVLKNKEEYNLFPNIGDFSTLGQTYYRMVIGVDSEGWIYISQKKYANKSTDNNVNIYKTKDFKEFELFKSNSGGLQLIELENGELCFATHEVESEGGTSYIRCNVYVTENNKKTFAKKFHMTQIEQYNPAYPWSWSMQNRGNVVAVSEYGTHGKCGNVWYSRDYGKSFYKVFDLRNVATDVPNAHVHGVCVDPYFDRLYIINGDGAPATSADLLGKNPRVWYWDYQGENLSNSLADTIKWNYIAVGEDVSLGEGCQFVNGYALKDCIVLFSDGKNNGIFRINRGKKEDTPTIDFAHHLGIETDFTKWCGGNMYQRDSNSPLLICGIREYSNDLNVGDANNPSGKPNTYNEVRSCIWSTYDGIHFTKIWEDDTYGEYDVFYSGGVSEKRMLAKCGRDMSVYHLPNGKVVLKYIGRDFTYVSYNNNGVTAQKSAYVKYCNDIVVFGMKI